MSGKLRELDHLRAPCRCTPARKGCRTDGSGKPNFQNDHERDVICDCRLELDPQWLGLHVCAYVRVRPMSGALPRVAEPERDTPEVVECHCET